MKIEKRLKELNLELPRPQGPLGKYVTYKKSGNLIYFSGQGPIINGKVVYKGKIGRELTLEDGYEASRLTALNLLAVLKEAVGDLDKVVQFVNVHGYVNCVDEFTNQPSVINGFSDLILEIFGDKGTHSRCAVPSGNLPLDTPVEIEMIVEVME